MKKKIGIVITVAIISIGFWLSLVPWLKGGASFGQVQAWLPPLLVLAIFSGCIALAVVLLDQKRYWVLIALLSSAPIFLVFGVHLIYLGYIGLAMLSVLYTGYNMKREMNERFKVDIRVMTRAGMRYIMLPILIGISFAYYFSPQVQSRAHSDALPDSFQRTIASTVQQFMDHGAVTDPAVGKMLTPVVIDASFVRINDFFKPYTQYFPPLFSFGLFIILWSTIFLFDWLGTLAARMIFSLLRKSKFVLIEERVVNAESIKL